MASRLQEMKDSRLDKLKTLKKIGVNPYPSIINKTHNIKDALEKDDLKVTVVGRLISWRGHGQLQFANLRDESGEIQLAFKSDILEKDMFEQLTLIDKGDFLEATGVTFTTKTGQRTVKVTSYRIICKTILPLPNQWYGLKNIEERFRKRYLDLILNPEVKTKLEIRSKVVHSIRDLLVKKDFIEVETPTLQPVYGGGFARPFSTHHNALDTDFYLRISDEMYLKRLIVGGFEKVFEITKVFRNEGVDHDHNPEFTMFEAMIAYEDYKYGMDLIEEIMEYAAIQSLGTTEFDYQGDKLSLSRPWKRSSLVEAIKEYTGIDPLLWKTTSEAKKAIISMKDINPKKHKELDKMLTIGAMIAFTFEETVEEKLIQPTIIYDYPIEVSPLAKKCKDPRFTQRFEMFAFGSELGNNYTELNDPIDLNKRFLEEKKKEEAGFDEAHQTDYDYLTAIEHGFPPTCGIAIGIDRFVMMLTDSSSIKEVIAFPTMKPLNPIKISKTDISKKSKSTDKDAQPATTESSSKKAELPSREKSAELLRKYIKDESLINHCEMVARATEAYAKKLGEDEELWYQTGLLHDLDWELFPDEHPNKALSEWLGNYPQEMLDAITAHAPGRTGKSPETTLERYLFACDEISGFMNAISIMRPTGFEGMKPKSVKKKLKAKAFAANVSRADIAQGLELLGKTADEHFSFLIKVFNSK